MASPILTRSPTICAMAVSPFLRWCVCPPGAEAHGCRRGTPGLYLRLHPRRPASRRVCPGGPLLSVAAGHRPQHPPSQRPGHELVGGGEDALPEQLARPVGRARPGPAVLPPDALLGEDQELVLGVVTQPPGDGHVTLRRRGCPGRSVPPARWAR